MLRTSFCVILLVLLTLLGCGEAEDFSEKDPVSLFEERYTGSSFLADYQASLPLPNATPPMVLDGEWAGFAYCPSGVYPMSAVLKGREALLSLYSAVGDPKKTTPFHGEHVNRAAAVVQVAEARRVSLTATSEEAASASKGRDLVVELILDPEQDTLAFGSVYEQLGTRRRSCSELILARSEAGDAMRSYLGTQEKLVQARPPVTSSSCPKEFSIWVSESASDGIEALQSERFTAVFGKPYLALTSERLRDLSALLGGSCITAESRSTRVRELRLASSLADAKTYQTVLLTSLGFPIVDRWRRWLDSQLVLAKIRDRKVLNKLLETPTALGLTRHQALRDLRAELTELSSTLIAFEQKLELARRIEQSRADFSALLAFGSHALNRDEVDSELIGEALDYYLETAGEIHAMTAKAPEQVAFLSAWVAQQDATFCPAANPDTCVKSARRISNVLDSRADSFSEAVQGRFDALMESGRSLARLARIVDFEREFARSHGAFANHKAFSRGSKKRKKIRRKEQRNFAEGLLEQALSLNTAPELLALQKQYFLGDEASSINDFAEILETKLSKTQPFAAFSGGRYFNALYNRDYKRLRELDQEYLAGIKPLLLFSAAQAAKFGPLLDALEGTKRGESAKSLKRSAANPTALYAVMGVYLVNYQERYADCLDETAPVFTITKQTDFVEKDASGYEIRRLEGWTSSDSYRVKTGFSKQFRALFNSAERSTTSRLLDYFLNDASVENLKKSTLRMMSSFRCDSPEIIQFERGLLAYDERVRQ